MSLIKRIKNIQSFRRSFKLAVTHALSFKNRQLVIRFYRNRIEYQKKKP